MDLFNIPLQCCCIMHISTETKITSSPNVMVEIGHWLLPSLPCYFFDFTNQLTLQSIFAMSAAFEKFWVEELKMEAMESVAVAITISQEACDDWLDKFNIKELHPFSDI